jgi:hypothetical protein
MWYNSIVKNQTEEFMLKRIFLRSFTVILSLVMLSTIFVACNKNINETTEVATDNSNTIGTETDSTADPNVLNIVLEGKSKYTIVTPDNSDDNVINFAEEIRQFKREYAIQHGAGSADSLTDGDILREVVNSVGKQGRLGQDIRLVVSVSMLTEGWDANTVTHICGIRAFGSQLLCEQVAGRALRRQSYDLIAYDREGNEIEQKNIKKYKKENPQFNNMTLDDFVQKFHPEAVKEEEIILNAMLLPREIIDSEEDFYCKDGEEYNVPKYIEMFNKRISGLLVCFKKEIRDKILINNPVDRPVFTSEEMELCSGEPNKISDQDTYEALMTMEDKEIKFWAAHPEFEIPFLEECDMNWDDIYKEYTDRLQREKELGIDNVRKIYEEVLNSLTNADIEALEENGTLPSKLEKIIDIDPVTGFFVSKEYPDIVIGNVNDMIDAVYYKGVFDSDSDIE